MDRRQELLEQYEDALFALAMDEVAVEQGRAYLEENRRLREEEVPQSVLLRGRRTLRRAFARRGLNRAGRLGSRAMRVASTLCLLFLVVFTSAFAALPQFRMDTFNFVIETFGDDKALYFGTASAANYTNAPNITATWLPSGYLMSSSGTTENHSWLLFSGLEGEPILAEWHRLTESSVLLDQEASYVESISIQDRLGILVSKENDLQILINNEDGSVLNVWSDALSREELITFANGLVLQ